MDNAIILKLGYACNQSCSFCKAGAIKINLSLDEIKKRIDQISNNGFKHIYLSGGEATIRSDFFEIIDYLKKKNIRYSLATNMIKFSDENFIENILKTPPLLIFGSIYSIDQEIDEKLTNTKTYIDRIKGLKNILNNKFDLVVNIVINKFNFDSISETIDKLSEFGIKKICISLVDTNGDDLIKDEFLPSSSDLNIILPLIKEQCKKKNLTLFLDNLEFKEKEYQSSIKYLKITHAFEPFEPNILELFKSPNKQKEIDMDNYKSLGLLRISKDCNQNCIFCNVFENTGEKFQLNLSQIKEELKRLKNEGVEGIVISGGEPTLNKHINQIINLIKSEEFNEIHMQTNAMLFSYPKFIDSNIHKSIDFFLIPLYSDLAKVSDALTKTPGSFNLTIQGINSLIEQKSRVVVNHVVCSLNYKRLIDFVKFYLEKFGNKPLLSFSYLQPNGRAKGRKDLVPKMSEVAPYLNKALNLLTTHNVDFKLAEGFPPVCFIEEYKDWHGEYEKLVRQTKDYLTKVNRLNKVKSPTCKKCIYDPYCLGVWKHYAEMYGTKELIPVREK